MGSDYSTTPQSKQTIEALWRLEKVILDSLDFTEVVQTIVNSALSELGYLKLGYRIIVLSLIDEKEQSLKRISISETEEAKRALEVTPVPFHEIVIPLSAENNYCIKAIRENKPYVTHDWVDILTPPYTPEEAKLVQQTVGIKTSMIYPISYHNTASGVMIFSLIKDESEVSEDEKDLIRSFTDVVGLAVQNAKLYTQLEGTTKQLDEANKHLTELDKMKDEFLSLASHELRTPMTAIKGYVWMIQNGKAGTITDTTKNYLDIIYKSTERLIHLVNDMLDISRIESGKTQLHPEETSIPDLINQVKNEFSAQVLAKNMTLVTSVGDSLPPIKLDKDKIIQVIENLIGNAIKYTPEGGKISINATRNDQQIEISVSDNGKGIAEEDIPKLFTKFTRLGGESLTTFSQPGTGLGLYLSKQYIDLHHGQIWVKSVLNQGSTFSFSLPLLPTS